jgi:sulfur-oxidizing protein SoxX
MLGLRKTFAAAGMAVVLTASVAVSPERASADSMMYPADSGCSKIENPTIEQKGWCTAINRRQGNCLACHAILINPWPEGFPPAGNIAPPLGSMKNRFDAATLRAQIYDSTAANPDSRMPPFGKNGILTDDQIDAIVAFLMTI